jgi:hypothetical protein
VTRKQRVIFSACKRKISPKNSREGFQGQEKALRIAELFSVDEKVSRTPKSASESQKLLAAMNKVPWFYR